MHTWRSKDAANKKFTLCFTFTKQLSLPLRNRNSLTHFDAMCCNYIFKAEGLNDHFQAFSCRYQPK